MKLRPMGADWVPWDAWLVTGLPGTCGSDPSRVSAPTLSYPLMPHVISVKASESFQWKLFIAVHFSLQCWWQNTVSSSGGCEEYLPKHFHLQPRGRCLWCQRVLQCFPGALLHQHVAEGKKDPHLVHLLTFIVPWNMQWFCRDYSFMWRIVWNYYNFFLLNLENIVGKAKEETVNTHGASEPYPYLTLFPIPSLLWNPLCTILCLAPSLRWYSHHLRHTHVLEYSHCRSVVVVKNQIGNENRSLLIMRVITNDALDVFHSRVMNICLCFGTLI